MTLKEINGKQVYYEKKSRIFAIARHSKPYDEPRTPDTRDGESWTIQRVQEVGVSGNDYFDDRRSYWNRQYHNPSLASRARLLRLFMRYATQEINPTVNTYVSWSFHFDHWWVKGKG